MVIYGKNPPAHGRRATRIHEVFEATPVAPGERFIDGITGCGTDTTGWLRVTDDHLDLPSAVPCRLCWPPQNRLVLAPPAARNERTSRA